MCVLCRGQRLVVSPISALAQHLPEGLALAALFPGVAVFLAAISRSLGHSLPTGLARAGLVSTDHCAWITARPAIVVICRGDRNT